MPPGVNRAAWDYIQSASVAGQYDNDLAGHPLFELDQTFIHNHLAANYPKTTDLVIADFGCGTGRIGRSLSPAGCRVLNIDLSQQMLRRSVARRQNGSSPFHLRANLAELSCLRSQSIDLGVCLFSSLGMIRGRHHRLAFLSEVCRSLKKNGSLIVHAHNRNRNLLEPGGLRWLIRSRLASLTGHGEFGDRVFPHRELPQMFLHIFSRRELIWDLRRAGFMNITVRGIDPECKRLLPTDTRFLDLLAGGFLAVGRPSEDAEAELSAR